MLSSHNRHDHHRRDLIGGRTHIASLLPQHHDHLISELERKKMYFKKDYYKIYQTVWKGELLVGVGRWRARNAVWFI